MTVHYDSLDINRDVRLDLPLREGVGTIAQDVAKLHHPVTIVDVSGVWSTLDSHLGFLTLDGINDYLTSLAADTVDLNFTNGDYSIGGWFFIASGGRDDKTLLGRFLVSNNGWELYHYTNEILTLRHHHAAGATLRTGAYSGNWAYNKWWFMGVSRHGASAQFWRGDTDGFAALPTTISAGGLIDPEGCVQNLYIGRDTTGVNLYKGGLWRPRVWGRYLSEADWKQIYEREIRWFLS